MRAAIVLDTGFSKAACLFERQRTAVVGFTTILRGRQPRAVARLRNVDSHRLTVPRGDHQRGVCTGAWAIISDRAKSNRDAVSAVTSTCNARPHASLQPDPGTAINFLQQI